MIAVPAAGGDSSASRVAAVDVGSNSVRLLVAEPGSNPRQPLRVLERLMTITRLGTGVDRNGVLDDAALTRTLECIAGYAERWREFDARSVRISATSAVRDARDRERFFDGVRAVAGVDAEVLSGDDEARTSFLGATATVAGTPPWLVLDIGGGSTELIVGNDLPAAMTSRQLGCVRLTERCLTQDPPPAAQVDAAVAVIDEELDAVEAMFDAAAARTLVGVAGTVTTLGALHLDLPEYLPERIHGVRVGIDDVDAITRRLASQTSSERAAHGAMAPGREDVIVAGCLILRRVMQRFHFTEVLVSESDILDGLALELLAGSTAASGGRDDLRR